MSFLPLKGRRTRHSYRLIASHGLHDADRHGMGGDALPPLEFPRRNGWCRHSGERGEQRSSERRSTNRSLLRFRRTPSSARRSSAGQFHQRRSPTAQYVDTTRRNARLGGADDDTSRTTTIPKASEAAAPYVAAYPRCHAFPSLRASNGQNTTRCQADCWSSTGTAEFNGTLRRRFTAPRSHRQQ